MTDETPDLASGQKGLSAALSDCYPEVVMAQVAEWHGVNADFDSVARAALEWVESLSEGDATIHSVAAVLAVLGRRQRPIRGAQFVREAILQGWHDVETGLCELLRAGVVVLTWGSDNGRSTSPSKTDGIFSESCFVPRRSLTGFLRE